MPTTRRSLLQSLAAAAPAAFAIAPPASAETMRPASSPSGRRRVIIDTDTATDDSLALLLALNAPHLSIEAITIVVGNVEFEQEARNALYTLEVAGRGGQVPVFKGTARSILRATHATATWVHGHDGMSDSNFPPPKQQPESENGVDAIIRLARRYPGEITLIAIGALTNVALAILKEPKLPQLLSGIVFMGGFRNFYGNISPAATYNIWVDPEAAQVVFNSGARITTVGFDVSVRSSVMTDADYDRVQAMNTSLSRFFLSINRIRRAYCKEHQKMAGSNHPDAITTALVIDPAIGTQMIDRAVQIETQSELTRGMMVVDELGVWKRPPNVTLCVEADEKRFKDLVFAALRMA
jgi:purine nucleosidase